MPPAASAALRPFRVRASLAHEHAWRMTGKACWKNSCLPHGSKYLNLRASGTKAPSSNSPPNKRGAPETLKMGVLNQSPTVLKAPGGRWDYSIGIVWIRFRFSRAPKSKHVSQGLPNNSLKMNKRRAETNYARSLH